MKKDVFLIFTTIFLILSIKSFSQLSITTYSIYAVGINTSQSKKISIEVKSFTNKMVEEIAFEADLFYNFRTKEHHRFSVGIGINTSPFRGFDHINSLVVPFELEIYPFQNLKKISFLFELAPEFGIEDGTILRNFWGIRYTFGN